MSNVGDFNGDGFDEIIIGSPVSGPEVSPGSFIVAYGKASGFTPYDGKEGFAVSAETFNTLGSSVSGAGDINGDGFGDLIVGSSYSQREAGSSYVVFGKASGFGATLDLSSLDDSNNGFRLDGVEDGELSGRNVSGAGDVNGDGFDDLIIASPHASPNGRSNVGSSYVVFGGNFTSAVTFLGSSEDDSLIAGTKASERFVAGNGDDTLNGGGGTDVFYGGAGNDRIGVFDLGFQLVDGGNGDDTLSLDGSGLNLDLASVSGKISGIEIIDLFGTGNNTFTLSALDLLNLSDTTNTLTINGNTGDRVVGLSNNWMDGAVFMAIFICIHMVQQSC